MKTISQIMTGFDSKFAVIVKDENDEYSIANNNATNYSNLEDIKQYFTTEFLTLLEELKMEGKKTQIIESLLTRLNRMDRSIEDNIRLAVKQLNTAIEEIKK